MTSIGLITIIFVVMWLLSRKKSITESTISDEGTSLISEEALFQQQNRFEKRLELTYLPDSPSGDEIYKYKNLMRPWYNQLSGKYRYDDKMIQKLRLDWSDYMSSLEDRNTYNYLSLESNDEKESDAYRNDHIVASRKVFAIEDAFASQIGEDAVKELARITSLQHGSFNREGEIAPEGFRYGIGNELNPIKK
jgi:hypothetical protein